MRLRATLILRFILPRKFLRSAGRCSVRNTRSPPSPWPAQPRMVQSRLYTSARPVDLIDVMGADRHLSFWLSAALLIPCFEQFITTRHRNRPSRAAVYDRQINRWCFITMRDISLVGERILSSLRQCLTAHLASKEHSAALSCQRPSLYIHHSVFVTFAFWFHSGALSTPHTSGITLLSRLGTLLR